MQWYWLVLGGLGVWRLTHLVNAEGGPGGVFVRLRSPAGNGAWRAVFNCFYCLSLWVAIPFALAVGAGWLERLLLWPALSAAAILLERLTGGAARAVYIEDDETPKE